MISLLHLDTLYNTYVRPFADAIGPEDDGIKGGDDDVMQVDGEEHLAAGGKKRKKGKKAKLEKGYIHLIEDCIGMCLDSLPLHSLIHQIPHLLENIKTIWRFYL